MSSSARGAACAITLGAVIAAAAPTSAPRPLPPIVFVSRHPVAGDPQAVPGLGPHHRADVTGGRLLRRDPDGSVRGLLPPGSLADVSDPAVSPDARWIAFAGVAHPDSGWRIYVCDAAGGHLRAVTRTDPGPNPHLPSTAGVSTARDDDIDPCWIGLDELCFASTRGAPRAEYADVPATNLFTVRLDGGPARRLTSERNGAEEPDYDPARDRIVYARWWFNARLPSRRTASGLTTDRAEAVPADTVNLWQAVEVDRSGGELKLAAGAPRPRVGAMGYQPCVLPDGDIAAVYALNTGLSPRSGPTGVHRLRRSLEPSVRIAGPVLDAENDAVYGTPRGLAAPSACSPAALPDGRLLMAYDPGARGDFGIWVIEPGGRPPTPVVDLPGTLELDPAALVPWPVTARHGRAALPPPSGDSTFTFFCRNLFATGPLDAPVDPAPPVAWPLRIRFFTTRPLPRRGPRAAPDPGDTLVLVREARVRADGSVLETGLPAALPMFEQIVDARGLPLATARGAAQVPGFNYGASGSVARCVGCHAGHSTLAASGPDARFRRFNAAPSAEASASSSTPGTTGPSAAIDARTRGEAARTAWIASGDSAEWLALAWRVPLRLDRVVLHLPVDDPTHKTALRVDDCDITLWCAGTRSGHVAAGSLGPGASTIATGGARCDRLEVRLGRARGTVLGARRLALAEIEALARLDGGSLAAPASPRETRGSP